MSLKRFPALAALLEDLTRLAVEESAREPIDRAAREHFGQDARKVFWPGLGEFWLTPPQVLVVRKLMKASINSDRPEVKERRLLAASGSDAESLEELFAGSPAWGCLVIPGVRRGRYRLADSSA
jgi:hypothetical protein